MRRPRRSFGLALFCLSQICAGQHIPASCLSYGPAVIHIRGTLVRKTSAGPPNYENIENGDKAETYWHINLDSPACVSKDKTEPELNPAQSNIESVQLVFDANGYRRYKQSVGKKVVGTGTLFGAHTGHHRTPVLMTVRSLEKAN